ncbi:unnamed protein product [Adineta steineri]|uniref:CUB domain-containing protein n=1 Tax=Adineta steineri TaxID=433720 RepID=A0A814HE90_9BILA|nr:unnamed protein product [Adineta steineri]CAF3700649.1 unnamed protein product [Adineta steineri]
MRNIFIGLFFYLSSLVCTQFGYLTQNYCLDEIESSTLSLKCPNNQLIKLGRVIYGYSWSNECSYNDKDCTMDVPREDIICSSIRNCTVHVVEYPLILQDCWNLAASYVQAEYECITEYSLQNICQSQDITLSHGFLSTPNYPNGFLSNLNCLCTLYTSSSHSIVLEIIDFHLPTCAEAGLNLWFGQNFQTKCLTDNPVILIGNIQQNVTFRFYTLKNINQGGFLMKYSLSPESNNATVRLQCYATSVSNPSTVSNNFLSKKSTVQTQNTVNEELVVTNSNNLSKRLRLISSTVETEKEILSMNKQQLSQNLLPNTTSSPRLNMTLIIIFIVVIIVFLIVINVLIWFICTSKSKSSKSTSSLQKLCSHQATVNNDINPSNRLKTLHSLLYSDHKTANIDPIPTNSHRDIDSVLSEYHIPTNSSSINLNHGFIITSKSNQLKEEPRQIHSWDDI